MSIRISMCAALAVALLMPNAVTAQDDVSTKLNQIIENMVTRDDLKEFVTKKEMEDVVKNLTDLIGANSTDINELKNKLDDLSTIVNDQKDIVNVISRQDSQGKPILALNNIMQSSPEFREELSGAVNNSLAAEGSLIVNNKTGFDRFLRINNRETHRIPANTTQTFTVGVGTVTTELVGEEAPKNWTISAPSNRQVIDIEPASGQVIVRRPVYGESIVVERPVVSETVFVQRPTVVVERPSVIVERPTVIVERPVYSETVVVQRPSVVVQSPVIAPPVFVGTPFIPAPTVVYERRGLFGRRLVPRLAF